MAADELNEACSPENGCAVPSDGAAPSAQPAPAMSTPERAAAAKPRLDIVSDTICPWCYVGKRKIEGALETLGREGLAFDVTWRPFQLNPEMPVEGVDRRRYRAAKFGSLEGSKARDAQVAAAGREVGLAFHHELMEKTPNTLASHAVIRLAHETGGAALQDAVVEALFQAYFSDGRDIGDPQALIEIGAGAGMDRGAIAATLSDRAVIEAVAHEDLQIRGMGLNGVPSVLIEGYFLFSGAQPTPLIADALRRAVAILAEKKAEAEHAPAG